MFNTFKEQRIHLYNISNSSININIYVEIIFEHNRIDYIFVYIEYSFKSSNLVAIYNLMDYYYDFYDEILKFGNFIN